MISYIAKHRYSILLGISIFLFIFVFFTQVHPIYPYDADDWTYLYRWRDAYPSTTQYNPTRVLPEVLTPICGEIAMVFVYPLVGNITISICILTSLVLAFTITAYMLLFYKMLKKNFDLKQSDSFVTTLLFFAFHFLLFAKFNGENQHLFYSFDLCCHYNYTIPNIIASCFVLLFIIYKFENYSLTKSIIRDGFFILGLYLIIFSHLFESIILIAYLGILLLFQIFSAIRTKVPIKKLARKYILHISIIVVWLVGLCFEVNGRRAEAVQDIAQQGFFDAAIASAKTLINMLFLHTNIFADILLLTIFVAYIVLFIRNKKERSSGNLVAMLLSTALTCCIYLVLMAAKSYPYYLSRLMTLYSVPFFVLLAGFIGLASIIRKERKVVVVIPFLLLLIVSKMGHRGDTFQDIQTLLVKQEIQGTYKISPKEILVQNDQFINAIIEADRRGEKETTISVPKYNHVDNWPIAYYYGKRLGEFLYKYGFVSNRIKVTICAQNLNTEDNNNGRTD